MDVTEAVVLAICLVVGVLTQYAALPVYDTVYPMELHHRPWGPVVRGHTMEAVLDTGVKSSWDKNGFREAQVTDIAIVYSNMSRVIFFIAVRNNTWLYTKYAVTIEPRHEYVILSYSDKMVNVTDKYVITDRSVKMIKLKYRNTVFIVRLKWVSSFKEIPEIQEETRWFIQLSFEEFLKNIVLGIVTTTFAIVLWYWFYRYKKYGVKEGI